MKDQNIAPIARTRTVSIPTPVEAWLAAFDLDAVEVDACPIVDCIACRPELTRAA
jgi:hypothetical protein